MNVFLQAFAYILSQEYLGFASFHKYGFSKLSRKFANLLSQCFASFRKVSQGFANGLSQESAKAWKPSLVNI